MESRLAVLGGCGAWPEPGRACSGFLLEHAGFRVALDLGYGTLSRLLALLGSTTAAGLDAVVVTHDHPDHVVDLHGLFRARLYDGQQLPRISLYAPEAVLERIADLEDCERPVTERVFAWQPLPAGAYDAGPFRLESRLLPHYVPNAGVRLSAPELTVAYTGDTGPDPALAELGRDADLFIVDATDRYQRRHHPARRRAGDGPDRPSGGRGRSRGRSAQAHAHALLARQRPRPLAGGRRRGVPRGDPHRRRGRGRRPALTPLLA